MTAETLSRALRAAYALDVARDALVEIGGGVGTRNFRAETAEGSHFVKLYGAGTPIDHEREALRLGLHARDHGVPVSQVVTTVDGDLIAPLDAGALSVHAWCPGAQRDHMTGTAADSAGRVLALIHAAFRDLPASRGSSPRIARWRAYDHTACRAHFRALLAELKTRAGGPFARRATDEVEQRLVQLDQVPRLLTGLDALPIQVIHGDAGLLNLLFDAAGTVTGIVDFRPPEPYFPDFEIARIAFDPATVAERDDWVSIAAAAYRAYAAVIDDPGRNLALGPRLWCCKLLRSDFGLLQHLRDPHPREQGRLDRYWQYRCVAAGRMLERLPELEARIVAVTAV